MGSIIEFRHTNFSYNGTNAFNDFNLEIGAKELVSIIGAIGSGKTTLLKMLCHKLPNGSCYFDGAPFSSYKKDVLRKSVVVVFDTPFETNIVGKELMSKIDLLDISKDERDARLDEILKTFGLEKDKETKIDRLPYSKQYLIKILRYLIIIPKVFAIDNLLVNLSTKDKEKIIEYIKKHEITFINVTSDLDETLYGNRVFVMENFVVIMEGNPTPVLEADTILKRLGFKLPLAIYLSIELCNYGILKKIYTSDEKLVKALWK